MILDLKEIISGKNFIIYFIVINLIGFFVMWLDKWKAKRGDWRIPEKTLFIITAIGGGIGTNIGMHVFKHKTRKLAFVIRFSINYNT